VGDGPLNLQHMRTVCHPLYHRHCFRPLTTGAPCSTRAMVLRGRHFAFCCVRLGTAWWQAPLWHSKPSVAWWPACPPASRMGSNSPGCWGARTALHPAPYTTSTEKRGFNHYRAKRINRKVVVAANSWHFTAASNHVVLCCQFISNIVGACLVASGFLAGGCRLEVDGFKVIGGGFVENVRSHHFTCFGGVFVLVV
jgi:hypothetical protein